MNSPYMGDFKVTQEYKGLAHDGLDLVGLDSKEIHSTVNGTVTYAGWENPSVPTQGFGQYVCIKQDGTNDYYYYGHLSKITVSKGDNIKITDVIGIEGNTGRSTGSHCHYCVRENGIKSLNKNISDISGIPNRLGTYNDGFVPSKNAKPNNDTGVAEGFDKSIAGCYKATTAVNFRKKPDTSNPSNIVRVIGFNETVNCYGYYSDVNGERWLYVQKDSDIGFVCAKYFSKIFRA